MNNHNRCQPQQVHLPLIGGCPPTVASIIAGRCGDEPMKMHRDCGEEKAEEKAERSKKERPSNSQSRPGMNRLGGPVVEYVLRMRCVHSCGISSNGEQA